MTQLDKLQRLANERGGSAFADVDRLLEAHGWRRVQGKGSHLVYKKPGLRSITIATIHGRHVKRIYVVDVLERLVIQE